MAHGDVEQGKGGPAPHGAVAADGQTTTVVIAQQAPNQGCECTAGWFLFGFGWAFPILWLVGCFLPFCTKKRQDRRAAIGSLVMIVVYAVVLGVVLGVVVVPGLKAATAQIQAYNDLAAALNAAAYSPTAQQATQQAASASAAAMAQLNAALAGLSTSSPSPTSG